MFIQLCFYSDLLPRPRSTNSFLFQGKKIIRKDFVRFQKTFVNLLPEKNQLIWKFLFEQFFEFINSFFLLFLNNSLGLASISENTRSFFKRRIRRHVLFAVYGDQFKNKVKIPRKLGTNIQKKNQRVTRISILK